MTDNKELYKIEVEEDKPPDNCCQKLDETIARKAPDNKLNELEKKLNLASKFQQLNFKDIAYGLACKIIFFGLGFLFILYLIDVSLINNSYINSNLLDGLFELVKFLVSTSIGFVFSIKLSNND